MGKSLALFDQILINGSGQLRRRKPLDYAGGPEKPANDSIPVHQERCRGRHDASGGGRGPGIQDTQGINEPVLIVSDNQKVWKIGLSALGVRRVLSRGDDDASLTSIEIIVMRFELTQLDHAKRSPPSTEEDNRAVLGPRKIAVCEDGPICSRGGEVRNGAADSERSSISG